MDHSARPSTPGTKPAPGRSASVGAEPPGISPTLGEAPEEETKGRKDIQMSRKIDADKLQKLTLLLGQTVAALRVNEFMMRRLLQWAASQSDDPPGFVREMVENTRHDLQQAGEADGRMSTLLAIHEALEYLEDLSATMQIAPAANTAGGEKGLAILEHIHFPTFVSVPDQQANGASKRHGPK
ncbi:hypothetical protein [Sinorhizobium psoraleae]|nr:hypothetical protein [Sinorhizobium psoraleae]